MTDALDPALLFEHAAMGIALLDQDGLVRRVNAPLRAVLGRSSAELIGFPLTRYLHDEDVATHGDVLARLEGSALSHVAIERRYRMAEGDIVLVREIISAVESAGAVVLMEDVTLQRREERERRAQMCLAHLGEMASVVAHEVRNALAGIGSAVEVIGQGFSAGTEERLAVEEVRSRVADLSEMARALVRVARARPMRRSARSVRVLLAEVASALADGDSPIQLGVNGPDVEVSTDTELLVMALLHLITTRAQAAVPPHVAVRAGARWVELRLDGGAAALQQGAEPRVELDQSLARCIIEAHGGELSIEHAGTAVISLPRAGRPE